MDYSRVAAKLSYIADGPSKALAGNKDHSLPGFGALMIPDTAICVQANLSVKEDEAPKLLLQSAFALQPNSEFSAPKTTPKGKLYLRLTGAGDARLAEVISALEAQAGELEVQLYYADAKQYIPYPNRIAWTEAQKRALTLLLGEENVIFRAKK
jgi:hypothetical protein